MAKFRPFQAPSQKAEVIGKTFQAVLRGVMIRGVALELLAREGLETIAPEVWYPLQKQLNVLKHIGELLGAETLYSIGYRIPYIADFSDRIKDVESALRSIDAAYNLAVRGCDAGRYEFSQPGPDVCEITCENPYPCEFDHGIVASLVDRFRGSMLYAVNHAQGSCRGRGGDLCRFRVEYLRR